MSLTGLTTWEKHNTRIFLDIANAGTPAWDRLAKSTVFSLAFNPETETFDFIDDASPVDLIKSYKPSMDQEQYLAEGDPLFDKLFPMALSLPVGTDAVRPCLIVYPKAGTESGTFVAQKMEATISFSNLDTVAKKLSFLLSFSNIVTGTVAFEGTTPTFTPAA